MRTRICPALHARVNHTLRPCEPPRSLPASGIPLGPRRFQDGQRILVNDAAGSLPAPLRGKDIGAQRANRDTVAPVDLQHREQLHSADER